MSEVEYKPTDFTEFKKIAEPILWRDPVRDPPPVSDGREFLILEREYHKLTETEKRLGYFTQQPPKEPEVIAAEYLDEGSGPFWVNDRGGLPYFPTIVEAWAEMPKGPTR